MEKFKLIGHSGCKLEIEKRDKRLFVVKTSKNKEYNNRLREQCEKQKKFKASFLSAPIVFNSQENKEGLFKFTMEYINGITLADHFNKIEISSIKNIAKKILKIIPKKDNFDQNAKKIFLSKITEMEKRISINENKVLKRAFENLKKFGWKYCIASDCHGDLTLENIIYKDGDLYLIDFLDSFYNSWMVDMAKIFQDVECFWSYRHMDKMDENLEIRLLILKQILLDKILSLKNGHEILKTIYDILLINLVRIVPYIKDKRTEKYLYKEINKIINKINYL